MTGPLDREICAVVPAAGRGTRLGIETPKILAAVGESETIWSILAHKLLLVADHVNLIMSPWGMPFMQDAMNPDIGDRVSISLQNEPVGMGDAVFCGHEVWKAFDQIIVVWGDQVNVSRETLEAALRLHGKAERTAVIPVVPLPTPYVEYRFLSGQLDRVLESREGEICAPGGLGDVGTFVLSSNGLQAAWSDYLTTITRGAKTGELNFLPFLVYLSRAGWSVKCHQVNDAAEARGVNTPDDLAFAANHSARLKAGLPAGAP